MVDWAYRKGIEALPASSHQLGLYIADIAYKNYSKSHINSHFYAIKWVHSFCGLTDPTDHPFPKMILEGARRNSKQNVNKRTPMTPVLIKKICGKVEGTDSLRSLRFRTMCLLSYSAFLRISELLRIKRCHLTLYPDHVTIFLPNSKTDQTGEGTSVHICRTGTETCPINCLQEYLERVNLTALCDLFIFRNLAPGGTKLSNSNNPITYPRARSELMHHLKERRLTSPGYGLSLIHI